MRNSIQQLLSGIRSAGVGFQNDVPLSYQGAGLTSATNTLGSYTIPASAMPDKIGVAARAAAWDVELQGVGTGATSGNWTLTLTKGLTVIGTATIAYNASSLRASVDLRDAQKHGFALNAGDTIVLNLTGVPGGTLSGGLTSVKTVVTTETYGIEC